MKTMLSMNSEEQRQAEALLKRLCSDGGELLNSSNRSSAELLEKHGMATIARSGNQVEATARGREENGSRIMRAP